ncbi:MULTISPECIES: hypothetical protein [unclassified Microbacterium]|uniref:hypothetical protein n=1 Tax=unclassified Microbacterium TaxID=2609290 RepID=UPI003015F8F5
MMTARAKGSVQVDPALFGGFRRSLMRREGRGVDGGDLTPARITAFRASQWSTTVTVLIDFVSPSPFDEATCRWSADMLVVLATPRAHRAALRPVTWSVEDLGR